MICATCKQVCVYEEEEIAPGEFYLYRRPQCQCEVAAEASRQQAKKEEDEAGYRKRLLHRSHVNASPKLTRMNLANFQENKGNKKAVRAVLKYLKTWPNTRGLVLSGQCGRGKTHLAVGVVRAFALRMVCAEFWQGYALLDSLRPKGEDAAAQYELEYFVSLPLLVIDDLGRERLTEWGQEMMFSLLDQRDLAERPTIVTTNLDTEQLERHLSEAIVSRLVGNCDWLELTGDDHRLKALEGGAG